MNGMRSAAIEIAFMAALLIPVSGSAADQTIKQLMGENFAGMQTILVALINSDYANIPSQATVIVDHAAQLTTKVPESAQADKDRFLALAFALKTNAESLKSISEILIQHDQEQVKKTGTLVGATELRGSLAGHYGGIVVTCVSCHSEFRPRKVGAP